MSPLKGAPEQQVAQPTIREIGRATLINEGGVVFALPGTVRLPALFTGDPTTASVHADRLDGGPFPRVAAAKLAADGTFSFTGPLSSKPFFAATEFQAGDAVYRLRSLARADNGEALLLDSASTLVSARIALAAQKRDLDGIDYTQTRELTAQVRSTLGTAVDAVGLDQPNDALARQLDLLARPKPVLAANLAAWEAMLDPNGAPVASASPAASPPSTASPGATPTPAPASVPVK